MHWEIPSMHARLFHVILFVRCSRSLWHYATLISSFNRLCAGGLKNNNNNNANRVQCLTLGLLVHIDELFNRSTCENIEFIKCIDSYDNFDFRDALQVVPYTLYRSASGMLISLPWAIEPIDEVPQSLWRMTCATPDPRLPPKPHSATPLGRYSFPVPLRIEGWVGLTLVAARRDVW